MASKNDESDLAAQVQRLKDLESIKRLKYRFCRYMDTADFDGLRSVLHPELTVDLVGGSFRFQCNSAEEFVGAMQHVLHAESYCSHTCHHPEIDFVGDGEAKGRWYQLDMMVDLRRMVQVSGAALYEDRYVKLGDEWKIRHTGYSRIFERVDPLLEKPNLTAHRMKARFSAAA
jgi:SnoaL-like domain